MEFFDHFHYLNHLTRRMWSPDNQKGNTLRVDDSNISVYLFLKNYLKVHRPSTRRNNSKLFTPIDSVLKKLKMFTCISERVKFCILLLMVNLFFCTCISYDSVEILGSQLFRCIYIRHSSLWERQKKLLFYHSTQSTYFVLFKR